MRFTKNSLATAPPRAKLAMVIGGIVVSALLVGLVVLLILRPGQSDNLSDNRYRDPVSGEIVSNPDGKTPETFGDDPNRPLYLGFSSLLKHGLTTTQLDGAKQAFYRFQKTLPGEHKEVSIAVDTIKLPWVDSSEPETNPSMLFDVVINRTNHYKARLEYFELRSVLLYIKDLDGKTVFDSCEPVN